MKKPQKNIAEKELHSFGHGRNQKNGSKTPAAIVQAENIIPPPGEFWRTGATKGEGLFLIPPLTCQQTESTVLFSVQATIFSIFHHF